MFVFRLFSIMINGSPKGFFQAQRGLRQGDPLSPFLFVIVAEALSRMAAQAEKQNLIRGFRVTRTAPISHLQFVDNTLVFFEANEDQIKNVKAILICFEAVSGLKINFFKSELIGIRVEESLMGQLIGILGCKVESFPVTYLGLPLCRGHANKVVWTSMVERKLSTWRASYLSLGGRITLIKAVLGNLPIYFMSILKCPVSVINIIKKFQREFLWHGRSAERKFHLVDWALVGLREGRSRESFCFSQ